MRRFLRLIGIVLAAALVLGNSQCQQNSSDNGPAFVTTLSVEDANDNQTSSFSSGQTIQFVLNVRNRTDMDQTIYMQVCFPTYEFVVLSAGTSSPVASVLGPTGMTCKAVGVGPVTIPAGQTSPVTWNWGQTDANGQLVASGNYEVMGGLICYKSASVQAPDTIDCMSASFTSDQLSPAELRSTMVPFTIQ